MLQCTPSTTIKKRITIQRRQPMMYTQQQNYLMYSLAHVSTIWPFVAALNRGALPQITHLAVSSLTTELNSPCLMCINKNNLHYFI
jgi:hypothetical protein